MATSIVAFNVICTAGATLSSGAMASMNVGPDPVTAIRWRVPPGPRGHLVWWLYQSGAPVFPNGTGTGVIADNEWDTWTLDSPPSNPVWELWCANSGTNNHVVELQFYIDAAVGPGPGPVDLTALFPQNDLQIPTMFLA